MVVADGGTGTNSADRAAAGAGEFGVADGVLVRECLVLADVNGGSQGRSSSLRMDRGGGGKLG